MRTVDVLAGRGTTSTGGKVNFLNKVLTEMEREKKSAWGNKMNSVLDQIATSEYRREIHNLESLARILLAETRLAAGNATPDFQLREFSGKPVH